MLNSGILSKVDHVTSWCSTSFPMAKPGSNSLKVIWVSDFKNLNRALRRPTWGSESSDQIMRRIDPTAKAFACFDAISGYH